jgi:hypothetical protein
MVLDNERPEMSGERFMLDDRKRHAEQLGELRSSILILVQQFVDRFASIVFVWGQAEFVSPWCHDPTSVRAPWDGKSCLRVYSHDGNSSVLTQRLSVNGEAVDDGLTKRF